MTYMGAITMAVQRSTAQELGEKLFNTVEKLDEVDRAWLDAPSESAAELEFVKQFSDLTAEAIALRQQISDTPITSLQDIGVMAAVGFEAASILVTYDDGNESLFTDLRRALAKIVLFAAAVPDLHKLVDAATIADMVNLIS